MDQIQGTLVKNCFHAPFQTLILKTKSKTESHTLIKLSLYFLIISQFGIDLCCSIFQLDLNWKIYCIYTPEKDNLADFELMSPEIRCPAQSETWKDSKLHL